MRDAGTRYCSKACSYAARRDATDAAGGGLGGALYRARRDEGLTWVQTAERCAMPRNGHSDYVYRARACSIARSYALARALPWPPPVPARRCRRCGADISQRPSQAVFCAPCAAARKRERGGWNADPARRERELKQDPAHRRKREWMRERRRDPAYLERERNRNRERMRKLRQDPAYRERERRGERERSQEPPARPASPGRPRDPRA